MKLLFYLLTTIYFPAFFILLHIYEYQSYLLTYNCIVDISRYKPLRYRVIIFQDETRATMPSHLLDTPFQREDSNGRGFRSPYHDFKTPMRNEYVLMDGFLNVDSFRLSPPIQNQIVCVGTQQVGYGFSTNYASILQSNIDNFQVTPKNKQQILRPTQKTTGYKQKLDFTPLMRTSEKQPNIEDLLKNQNLENYGKVINFQSEQDNQQNEEQIDLKKEKNKRTCEKGLKNLSTTVADIIKTNSKITYKDVANKLIGQYINEGKISSWHHNKDIQNAKRRVYDALNVLLAANVLVRQGKLISFLSKKPKKLISPSDQSIKQKLLQQITDKKRSVSQKDYNLVQLYTKYTAAINLQNRNRQSKSKIKQQQIIKFPFVFLKYPTNADLQVNNISSFKTQIVLDNPFQIWGDIDIAVKLGLHKRKAKGFVSKQLQSYIEYLQKSNSI